jgi:hypothetical protein
MRLGVMYIGWNDRIWRGYDIKRGWTELKGCFSSPAPGSDTTCHRNHIHISFTWDGASARNSFWSGNPMNVPYCPTQRATGSVASPGRAGGDPTAVGPVRVVDTRSGAGVPGRCRLAQDRESGDSNRIVAKVLGQGGIPASGVAAVQVTASALGATAPSKLRIWSPGENKSVVVATPGMNQDANGTAIVPVSTDGTIELAIRDLNTSSFPNDFYIDDISLTADACTADVGAQGGVPGHDGLLDNNDFISFIDLFFTQNEEADLGSQGGIAGSDNTWDNNDFIVFIDAFFNGTGCV